MNHGATVTTQVGGDWGHVFHKCPLVSLFMVFSLAHGVEGLKVCELNVTSDCQCCISSLDYLSWTSGQLSYFHTLCVNSDGVLVEVRCHTYMPAHTQPPSLVKCSPVPGLKLRVACVRIHTGCYRSFFCKIAQQP